MRCWWVVKCRVLPGRFERERFDSFEPALARFKVLASGSLWVSLVFVPGVPEIEFLLED